MADVAVGAVVLLVLCTFLRIIGISFRLNSGASILFTLLLFGVGLVVGVPGAPLGLGNDYSFYFGWATEIHSSWEVGVAYDGRAIWPGKGVWPLIIGAVFWVFGPNHYVVLALSAFVTGLFVLILQVATGLLTGRVPRLSIVVFLCTSAAFVLYGALLLREPFFWLGTSLALLGVGFFQHKEYVHSFLTTCTSGLVLVLFRPDLGVIVLWGFLGLNVLAWVDQKKKISWKVASTASLLLLALVATLIPTVSAVTPGMDVDEKIILYNVNNDGEGIESGFRSGNQEAATVASSIPAINLAKGFLGPFPSELENKPVWYLAGLSSIHFWGCFALALFGMRNWNNSRLQKWGMLLMFFALTTLFITTFPNYGSLSRFRIISEIVISPYALAGMMKFAEKLRCALLRLAK